MNPLGNPTQKAVIVVTDVAQTITLTQGLMSMELQNSGQKNCYYGASDVTSDNGGILYSAGDRKSWENLASGWKVSLLCKSGETTTLRRIDYV